VAALGECMALLTTLRGAWAELVAIEAAPAAAGQTRP